MRLFFALLLMGVSAGTFAMDSTPPSPAPGEQSSWKVGGKAVEIKALPERHLLISASCIQQDSTLDCEAYKALSKAKLQGLKKNSLAGGANPGAVICSEKLGGKVVIAQDEHSNEQSFCLFGDSSLVDSGSILFWATSNPGGLK